MNSQTELTQQTALITGADSGIGEGIAYSMAAAGANVIVNYAHNEEAAHRVVKQIQDNGGDAIAAQADVSQEEQVVAMFRKACSKYGTVQLYLCWVNQEGQGPISRRSVTLEDLRKPGFRLKHQEVLTVGRTLDPRRRRTRR